MSFTTLKIVFVVWVLYTKQCRSEVFSSMAEVERVVHSSEGVPELVEKYIESEKLRLERLQQYAQLYSNMHSENAQFFTHDALHNPTSAYLILKLIATYWTPIETAMKENEAEKFLKDAKFGTATIPQVVLPNNDDVQGMAKAIMVLQTTYELETKDLADGRLPTHASPVIMTAKDCYDIGRIAYDRKSYSHTILWMQEALERSEREKPGSTISEGEILEYLAYPLGETGEITRALALTKRLLELVPDHPRAPGNIAYYESVLANPDYVEEKEENWNETYAKWRKYGVNQLDSMYDHYAALCRGDIRKPESDLSKLNCYYKNDRPFLKLAPLKVELLLREPTVRLFRNVISEQEISTITQVAFPKLFRSMVVDASGGGSELSESRVSKNTWLHDREHPNAAILTKRVSDMTDLDMGTAEEFQVANYGIGGHYQPHVDMLLVDHDGNPDEEKLKNVAGATSNGDRIATVLFYISQPEGGGATVFPELNLTLFPSKHDAVFWPNYKRNGQPNMKTRHSGCPVLIGSKWILNKWIHERGQEFRRPCSVNEEEYE